MEPFLKRVVEHIHLHYKDNVENLCIVLPSKRGSVFLKEHFKTVFKKAMWLPSIKSAEEFIEELSGLKQADEIDLLAILYQSYLQSIPVDPEPFDKFSKWGHLMLQDFNEIDRYLVPADQIYQNLKDIKEIENWSLGETELTTTQSNYLAFMASIGLIYKHYTETLLQLGIGYQGLIYRKASERFQNAALLNEHSKFIFSGFNALNAAETKIYKAMQDSGKAEMLWDVDVYYYKDPIQEAGMFLRRNLEIFHQKDVAFVNDHFHTTKEIHITAVAGQMGQAQLVHDELNRLLAQQIPLSKVAVVLANEKLLWPVLKLLPKEIEHVNITMEYPIRYTQAYSFIDLLLSIQLNFQNNKKASTAIYHTEFISVIQHSFFSVLLKSLNVDLSIHSIIDRINQNNFAFINQKLIADFFSSLPAFILDLFKPWANAAAGNAVLVQLINHIRDHYIGLYQNNIIHLELEYLEVLMRAFNRISEVLNLYTYYNDVRSYKQLYAQTVGTSSVPFIGEPLRGLQIMGVLETRTLDFEYLIMVGVNEGVLPSGKTVNSFLPNDLKRVFNLPLYYEKDAIYAYHFYRLMQRANFVHLIYDSETDELGKGEKSRFVTQLQFELKKYHPQHLITESVAVSESPVYTDQAIVIEKNKQTLERIYTKAISNEVYGGLSPSALITFKECSLKYYFRYGVGLKELKEVEESAEANTFGSILHLALENLYKPLVNKVLVKEDLMALIPLSDGVVEGAFKETFPDSVQIGGKNYLQIEVLKVYVKRMIDQDIQNVASLNSENKYLTILYLEKEWEAPLEVNVEGKKQLVQVKGKIDRIDKYGEIIRVIDYKNSIKKSDKFTFTSFDDLFTNVDHNKQFQLFTYVWLMYKNKPEYLKNIKPGIIPFKHFLKEPQFIKAASRSKETLEFDHELIVGFESQLSEFISTVFNEQQPFVQTEDLDICEYCGYNAICNR
ncbi:MAG: PD-(D/E)XK nuclease family protein [Sphingobacteriaceae bacterium]